MASLSTCNITMLNWSSPFLLLSLLHKANLSCCPEQAVIHLDVLELLVWYSCIHQSILELHRDKIEVSAYNTRTTDNDNSVFHLMW